MSEPYLVLDINVTNMTYILYDAINLLVNNDEWISIRGYCRFVLSVEESVFEEGINCFKQFQANYL